MGRTPRGWRGEAGRLFFWTPDPTPEDWQRNLAERESDLKFGVRTVNEVRHERGLPPVAWGNQPYKVQTTQTITTDDLDKPDAGGADDSQGV